MDCGIANRIIQTEPAEIVSILSNGETVLILYYITIKHINLKSQAIVAPLVKTIKLVSLVKIFVHANALLFKYSSFS